MAVEVPPSHVPQGGLPPRAALALVLVALGSIVGFAVLGKTPEAPAPSWPPAALVGPSPTSRWSPAATATAPAPTPPPCVAPRVAALTVPIARHPRPMNPTGFEVLTPWTGSESSLVADAEGGFWASGSGRLMRLDAKGVVTASWTFAHDVLFGAWGLVPAREGGVWLWGRSSIAWFDGERFRDVVATPALTHGTSWVVDIGEAPDGSLWAAVNADPTDPPSSEGTVFHWDGVSCTDVCGPWRSFTLSHLAVDAAGGVWVAADSPLTDVSRFDGARWSIPPSDPAWTADRGGVNAWAASLVAADDGSLWFAYGGLGHFEGKAWASAGTDAIDLPGTGSLAVAPDGSVWRATGSVSLPGDTWGPHTGTAVAHFEGGSRTTYDAADGLPAPRASSSATITAVAASREAVIVATRDGFYRLTGDRWVRAGRSPATGPAWAQRLLAVSAREAWAVNDDGLWHLHDGAWTRASIAGWKPSTRAFDVARAPDGTIAVATDKGTAVLRDQRWTVLGTHETHAVTVARDGAIWAGEWTPDGAQTTVASFRFDGRAWVRTALPTVSTIGAPSQLIPEPDGGAWLLSMGWGSELHQFDGASWVRRSGLGGPKSGDAVGLAVAPNGDIWALAVGNDQTDWAIARLDGETWTVRRAADGLRQPGIAMFEDRIAFAPDGSPWVATDRGLVHFDGRRWSQHFAGSGFWALSFAPDGTLWVVGPSGVQRLPANLLLEPDPDTR